MSKKYLVVKGVAGLGNRLFSLCDAIMYAKKTNRILLVDWSDGYYWRGQVNIFPILFSIHGIPTISSFEEIPNINECSFYPTIWKNNYKKGFYDLFEPVQNPIFFRFPILNKIPFYLLPRGKLQMFSHYLTPIDNIKNIRGNFWKYIKGIFDKSNFPFGKDLPYNIKADIVFYCDYIPANFHTCGPIFLKHISLSTSIKDKVFSHIKEMGVGKNWIGIHIRGREKALKLSFDKIVEKIKTIPLKDPQIFLATDTISIRTSLKDKLRDVHFYNWDLPKGEVGVHILSLVQKDPQEAINTFTQSIIDLWTLAHCEYLLYQSNSSFSHLAKILHPDKNKCMAWDA